MVLSQIGFSHEINYPKWVDKLKIDLARNPNDYKRIKVFHTGTKWIVIDGNHRLKALKSMLPPDTLVNVLKLKYK